MGGGGTTVRNLVSKLLLKCIFEQNKNVGVYFEGLSVHQHPLCISIHPTPPRHHHHRHDHEDSNPGWLYVHRMFCQVICSSCRFKRKHTIRACSNIVLFWNTRHLSRIFHLNPVLWNKSGESYSWFRNPTSWCKLCKYHTHPLNLGIG